MALILKHQTAEAFVQKVRAAYRDGNAEIVLAVARFILSRLAAGDITDAQCRNAFSLNVTQWNALKTRMQNYVTADNTVKAATGE